MTREDVKALFPDATDEQITNLLNKTNSELAGEKAKSLKNKEMADKAAELQKQLDEINSQNLSDIEKANKALETANARIAELEKASAIANLKTTVADKFKVSAEQAGQIVKEDGSLDYDVLGKIIADKEVAAATAKEQEIANGSTNPGGGTAGNSGADSDNEIVNSIASNLYGGAKATTDIVNNYL